MNPRHDPLGGGVPLATGHLVHEFTDVCGTPGAGVQLDRQHRLTDEIILIIIVIINC